VLHVGRMAETWDASLGAGGRRAAVSVRRTSAAVAASVALSLSSTPVQAFCRTTTCDRQTECEYDARGCASVGLPLIWKSGCVSYSVHHGGSAKRGVDYASIHSIAERAFGRWTSADCEGTTPSIGVADFSPASCGKPEYNPRAPNANVIMFRDHDWPDEYDPTVVAHTVVTFNTETGEILDADIEVNSFGTPITTSDTNVGYDLESIIVHEVGHFLGLDHSHLVDATMFSWQAPGDLSLRDLIADDTDGICSIYPSARSVAGTNCQPRRGFSPDCRPPEAGDGCTIADLPGGPTPTRGWPLTLVVLLGIAISVRRRRSSLVRG
jgi:hypothetical protein